MATIDDFGGPQNPLSAPSLSEWAQAVRDALVALQTTDADADARYVNADGDTMTGDLRIGPTIFSANPAKTNIPFLIDRSDDGFGALAFRRSAAMQYYLGQPSDSTVFRLYKYAAAGGGNNIAWQFIPESDTVDLRGSNAVNTVLVPVPKGSQHVPRLARTPDAATGDLGMPGYAGSDTGWRDVTSQLANGWGVEANGFAKIRRVGSTVTFVVRNVSQPGTNQTLYALPLGFRFNTEYGVTRYFDSTASNAANEAAISGNNVNVPTTWTGGTTTRQIVCSGTVSEAWPTSLPGVEVTPPAQWT